jgi:hypothetical protein
MVLFIIKVLALLTVLFFSDYMVWRWTTAFQIINKKSKPGLHIKYDEKTGFYYLANGKKLLFRKYTGGPVQGFKYDDAKKRYLNMLDGWKYDRYGVLFRTDWDVAVAFSRKMLKKARVIW